MVVERGSLLWRSLVLAAARDCGNRNMKASGRTVWNENDYNAAAAEANRLLAEKGE